MRINRKLLIGISISIVLAISTFVIVYFVVKPDDQLIEHDNIIIWNDKDFKNYEFKGEGTIENPYLIQNLKIETNSREGIYIAHTTKYFVIQNNYIDAEKTGIIIYHVANDTVTIADNTLIDNEENGIFVVNSDFSKITNNNCTHNGIGIKIEDSDNTIISGNICNNNQLRGIHITSSSNSIVKDNICDNNRYSGISVEKSPYALITNNTCRNSEGLVDRWIYFYSVETGGFGIFLFHSPHSTILNNTLEDNFDSNIFVFFSRNASIIGNNLINGILALEARTNTYVPLTDDLDQFSLDYYLSFKVENNLVNNKNLGFYTNLVDETISSTNDGQMIFVNCTNLKIADLVENVGMGVSLYYCNNAQISNNRFVQTYRNGLSLFWSSNANISGNIISSNPVDGLVLFRSNNSVVQNNTCNGNTDDGINDINLSNTTITENTCKNNIDVGIASRGSNNNSYTFNLASNNLDGFTAKFNFDCYILNNTFSNNAYAGISILYTDGYNLFSNNTLLDNYMGIFIRISSNHVISHNVIERNMNGIWFYLKLIEGTNNHNIIHNNSIADNTLHGIYMQGGSNNTVYHNSFVDNNLAGISQAYDSGYLNYWFNTNLMEGNLWSDWLGVGNYTIEGTANSEDPYPL